MMRIFASSMAYNSIQIQQFEQKSSIKHSNIHRQPMYSDTCLGEQPKGNNYAYRVSKVKGESNIFWERLKNGLRVFFKEISEYIAISISWMNQNKLFLHFLKYMLLLFKYFRIDFSLNFNAYFFIHYLLSIAENIQYK